MNEISISELKSESRLSQVQVESQIASRELLRLESTSLPVAKQSKQYYHIMQV